MPSNAYSRRWHETFSRGRDGGADIAFLAEWLPPGRVLDVCCGFGRHVHGLRELGYEVVGVERDPKVAEEAGALCLDMRELERVTGEFDGVISMWASFGYFSEQENLAVLDAMKAKLRPGGRLVLDLWNRDFLEPRPGTRVLDGGVLETSSVEAGRRHVRLEYRDGAADEFDVQVFTSEELRTLVRLPCLHERSRPDEPRLLLVFERSPPPEVFERAYLAGADPRAQSGFGGDEERWEAARRPIADVLDRDGSFLDVGCASGYLMECVVRWSPHRVEPYGLDVAPGLVDLARRRLPRWADRIFLGDVLTWEPPRRFDFVRTELVYVPDERYAELVERLLTRALEPDGRLIVCGYGSPRRRMPAHPVGAILRSLGHEPVVELAREAPEGGGAIVELAVLEARASG